jgi:importin subunit alpha-1
MFGARAKQDTRKSVKATISADDSRKKREETSNEIRKNKREESLLKRRNFAAITEESTEATKADDVNFTIEHLPQAVAAVSSMDPNAQLEGTILIRKLLSIGNNYFLNNKSFTSF